MEQKLFETLLSSVEEMVEIENELNERRIDMDKCKCENCNRKGVYQPCKNFHKGGGTPPKKP